MTENPSSLPAADARAGLAEQLRVIEAFVARAEAQGEELPAAAVEMVARLREIMEALAGLASSFGERADAAHEPPEPPTPAE